MKKLSELGWSTEFEPFITHSETTCLARITSTGQNTFQGIPPSGPCHLKLTGKISHTIKEKFDLPTVGDWVVTDSNHQVIQRILPRKSSFVRNVAGNQDQRQVIAANLEELWIVTSLNHDFNLNRLNRYIINAWDSGAVPVIILTKADLIKDYSKIIEDIQAAHPGIEVIPCSSVTEVGLTELKARLVNYQTIALVGSSGVGKSTLINQLAEKELQTTSSIREDDSRGRHTTTSRNLLAVGEAWLVDTPGMREFGLWATTEQLEQNFEVIADLAKNCRFNDCQHRSEPGCEVTLAIEEGRLTAERFREYQKLQRELAYLEKRTRVNLLKQQKHRR